MVRFDTYRSNLGRIRFLQVVIVILFCILAGTIFCRQYLEFVTYNRLNEKQCLRRILYPGIRGIITDRNGKILATHQDSYCLYVDLNFFKNKAETFFKKNKETAARQEQLWALVHDALLPYAKKIGPIPFRVSKKTLLQHYQQNILLPLALAKDLSKDLYAQLLNLLPINSPFHVAVEKVRYYPYGRTACHVIGYVARSPELKSDNLPGNDLRTFFLPKEKGRTGIEAFYDEELSGYNGGDIWRVTPSGQEQKRILSIPSVNGSPIQISLNIDLQKICEKALDGHKGSISVVDIKSGDVLAMVSKPDFDLNDLTPFITKKLFNEITESGAWLNRAIQGLYPPGSTFKLISLSALLRANVINARSTAYCEGSYRIGNRFFKCHQHQGHGLLNTVEAIQKSCNPFMFKFGLQLGPTLLHREACFYYLNVPTGIDLPYETDRLLIPSPEWKKKRIGEAWADGDTANMLIGQGYLLQTPFKMTCFVAALANNKNVFLPHLVKSKTWVAETALPISAWNTLVRGMQKVGEGYFPRLSTAIKTGTAQIKMAGKNQYTHIGWLVGFAPVKNPQIAFCVEVEQDGFGNNFWGGKTCAPIAKTFLDYYFGKSQ